MRSIKTVRARKRRHSAFSLVEMVMVVAVISVVAAIAVPRFGGAIARRRADSAATRIVLDLALARHHARVISGDVTITFASKSMYKVNRYAYTMTNVPDPNVPTQPYSVDLKSAPYHVTNWFVDFGGTGEVTFDMYGTPNSNGSIVIRVGKEVRTIQLDQNSGKADSSDDPASVPVSTTGFPTV